jgi:chorismate-pyruvate lyase
MESTTAPDHPFDPNREIPSGKTADLSPDQARFDELPPFLRALLVTDGTVTRILEAYTGEPIEVRPIHQAETVLKQDVSLLELAPGQPVVERRVLLHGVSTGRNYTFAESLIRTDRLWAGLREDLLRGKLGMGEILRDRRMETHREILSFREEAAGNLSTTLGIDPGDRLLVRSYRIFHRQSPAILITEKFPVRHFA